MYKRQREERARLQKAFGYTYEEYRESICSMALNGTERIGAMGVDTPLAVLSREFQPLFYYCLLYTSTDHKNQIVSALTGAGYRPKLVKFKGTYSDS